MQTRIEVGILGATGMVGQHFVKFLQGHPWFDLKWLGASDRSAGKKYKDAMTWHLAGGVPASVADLTVEECKPGNAPKLMFSATDASVATEIERAFAAAGHVVVSNSKNHRMESDVPPAMAGVRTRRRGGRVAEGGGLLNRYTVKSCIGGSNPPLSARNL